MKTLILMALLIAPMAHAQEIEDKQEVVEVEPVDELAEANRRNYALQLGQEICMANFRLISTQDDMEQEKEIQKIGGTKDLRRIHNNATVIVRMKRQLKNQRAEYKEIHGQDHDLSECP